MNIKISDIFEEVLHQNNPPNISIMGRICRVFGWTNQPLKFSVDHLVLLLKTLHPNFHPFVDENLNILSEIKAGRAVFDDTVAKKILSEIKIGILHCPQNGCIAEFFVSKKYMGYNFMGPISSADLHNEPLKKQKLIYYETEDKNHDLDVDKLFKKMCFSYISKQGLLRCDENIYGIFDATTHQLIAFLDFSDDKKSQDQLSNLVKCC